jgi:hypothetical protein
MFDVVILSSGKDFNKLGYVYDSIMENIVDDLDNIYLISDKRHNISSEVVNYIDDEVLDIDRSDISYRPNWIAQQYIKLFQDVTENDNNKPTFFFGRDQNHAPYFRYSQIMFGFGREYHRSFINEFMLFDKRIIKDMLSGFNDDRFEFIRRSNAIITSECYISEFELYGNYVYKYHENNYNYKNIKTNLGGKRSIWDDRSIVKRIIAVELDY